MFDQLRDLQQRLSVFEKGLRQLRAGTVTRAELLSEAKLLVDQYFRQVRSQLTSGHIDEEGLISLDRDMQTLLEYTHRRTPTTNYRRLVKRALSGLVGAEKGLLAEAGASAAASSGDATDRQIIETLKHLLPGAALAYEQALIDLSSSSRLSWRGPATDFREALRETLDHLAPDEHVVAQAGFRLETNAKGPTMKQKVRYVLRARDKTRAAIDTTEAAVGTVDEIVGSFVRSVYNRSSISTHTATTRNEVLRVRDFVRVALCELLEIHPQ